MRCGDSLPLTLFAAPAEQNQHGLFILSEKTPPPTPFTFEKLPVSSRYRAAATLAAEFALKLSNHAAYGDVPRASMYSRTLTFDMAIVT